MRTAVAIVAGLLWLGCLAAAMFTVVPFGAMGLFSIFDGSFPVVVRMEGLGSFALSILAIVVLLASLNFIIRISNRTVCAQD